MNELLRSFLYAMASAALAWIKQLDDDDVIIGWLESEADKLRVDTK